MDRNTAVTTWRDVCGSDSVMAMGMVTGRMLEEFARRIEAAERERCAKLVETMDTTGHDGYIETTGDLCDALAERIRRA